MSKIDYQALREAAQKAKELGNISRYTKAMIALLEFKESATPDTVLALLDELEAAEKLIDTLRQDKDKVIDMGIESVNKLLSRAKAAEKRIAELEARTVTLPQYRNSPEMHTKQFYEAIGFNQGLDIFIEAIRAAGIHIKGD